MFLPWKKKNVKCKEQYSRLSSLSSRSDLEYRKVPFLPVQSQHVSSAPYKTWIFLAHLAQIRCATGLNLQAVSLKISPYNHTASSRRLSIFKESRERPNIKSTGRIDDQPNCTCEAVQQFLKGFLMSFPPNKRLWRKYWYMFRLYFDFPHHSGHTVRFCLQ